MLQAPGARLLQPRGARLSRTAFKTHSLTAHARRRSHAAINDLLLPPAVLSLDREAKNRKNRKKEKGPFQFVMYAVVWALQALTLSPYISARAPQLDDSAWCDWRSRWRCGAVHSRATLIPTSCHLRPCYTCVISISCAAKRRLKQSISLDRYQCSNVFVGFTHTTDRQTDRLRSYRFTRSFCLNIIL